VSEAEFTLLLTDTGLIKEFDPYLLTILQWKDIDIYRQPVSFLFPADVHGRVDKLVARKQVMEKVVFPKVPLRFKPGGFINFDMRIVDKDGGDRQLLFFKPGAAEDNSPDAPATADMYSFFNFVEQVLDSPYEGDLDMTMIEVEALKDDSLTEEQRASVRAEVEANLKGKAVGGQIGQLDEASYGLLAAGDFNEDTFEKELVEVASKLDIHPGLMGVRTASVTIDDRDIDPETLRRALSHTRSLFLGEVEGDENALDTLSAVLDGVEHHRNLLLSALKNYHFRVSERFILDNRVSIRVAALQQGKCIIDGRLRAPDELIVLPDHPDVALQHDLAQLDEFARARTHRAAEDKQRVDFYELCRSTLVQEEFYVGLREVLARYSLPAEQIGFRLKGLPPAKRGGLHWDKVYALGADGHPLWLDRFGDVVTAPDSFGFMQGGYIELPKAIMKKLEKHFDGKEMMSGLVMTWQKQNIGVVAADLGDDRLRRVAQDLGIPMTLQEPA